MIRWGLTRSARLGRATLAHAGSWLLASGVRLVAGGVPIIINTGGGTALSAPVITRTSGVTTYPVTIDIARQPDWQDGDKLQMRWGPDSSFISSVNEGAPVTLDAATTTITVGIAAITAGTPNYIEGFVYRGARPVSPNESNIVGVGDTTTPTISSSNSASGYQFVSGTKALTASKSGYWAIVGGSYQAQFAISGNNLNWDAQTGTPAMDVQVQFTDYFGNASTAQTITVTIGANTPDAFTFTDVTNSSLSTQYTSNTITIAGLQGGASVPVTITGGTYSKNGGAYTSAAGTVINGDTITLRCTSPSGNNGTTTVVVTAGVTSDTWTVASPVVLTTTTTWNPSDKAASISLSAGNMTADGTVQGTWAGVRSSTSKSSGKRYVEITSVMTGGLGDIGVADGSETLSVELGQTVHSTGYRNSDGRIQNGQPDVGTSPYTNNVVGLAIDCDAGTVDYYLDNVLQGSGPNSGNPVLSAPIYIMFTAAWTSTTATLNTGHSAWVYGPPAGYEMAWDV